MAIRRIGATPQDYGAVGDGTTDDTTAFRNLFFGESRILIPPAKYRLTDTLTIYSGDNLTEGTTIPPSAGTLHPIQYFWCSAARGAVLSFEGLGTDVPCIHFAPNIAGQIGPDEAENIYTPGWCRWEGGHVIRDNNSGALIENQTTWFMYWIDVELQGGNLYFSGRGGDAHTDPGENWYAHGGAVACYGHGGAPDIGLEYGRGPYAFASPGAGESNRCYSYFNRCIGSGKAGSDGLQGSNGGLNVHVWGSFDNFDHGTFQELKQGGTIIKGHRFTGLIGPVHTSTTHSPGVSSTVIGRNLTGGNGSADFRMFGPSGETTYTGAAP